MTERKVNNGEPQPFCPFLRDVCYAVEMQRIEFCPIAMTQGSHDAKQVICGIKRIAISLARIEWNNKPFRFPKKEDKDGD